MLVFIYQQIDINIYEVQNCFFFGCIKDFSNCGSKQTVEMDRIGKEMPILK